LAQALMPKKKKGPTVDDLLAAECKHWGVTMVLGEKKEKKDAAEARQNQVREALKQAQDAYQESLRAPAQAMQDWFFHRAEKAIL
jgi:hypothetical protein